MLGSLLIWQETTMRHDRIEMNPEAFGAGMSPKSILADHPRLTHDDIEAAQTFAADYLASEDIICD